ARRFGRIPPGRLHIAFVLRQHEARRGSDVVGGDAAHPGAPRSDVQLSHDRVFDALAQLVQVSVRVEELLRINQRVQASHERSEVELEAAAGAVSAGGLEKGDRAKGGDRNKNQVSRLTEDHREKESTPTLIL